MENILLGQIAGICATIITFISYQMNTKRSLLIVQTLATLCTCLSFLFLGASTGFALNIVCIVRNFIFYFQSGKSIINRISTAFIVVIMIFLGAFSWQGAISLLVITGLAANTVFMSFGQPQLLRKSILLTSSMVLLYDVFVFSIGGITNEAVSIISSVIGIVRLKTSSSKNGGEECEANSPIDNRENLT